MATVINSTTTGVISRKSYWDKFCDLFIICSGANRTILEQCPTERPKYIISGFTIVFTAIMAAFSSGYAFFYTFNSYYASIPLGIIWGFLIFNLDRAFVTGMRKPKIPTKAEIEYQKAHPNVHEGWKAGPLQEERNEKRIDQIGLASIRIIVAIVIGIVIARPLELRLFKANINNELLNNSNIEDSTFLSMQVNSTKSLEIERQNIIKRFDSLRGNIDKTNSYLNEENKQSEKNDVSLGAARIELQQQNELYQHLQPKTYKKTIIIDSVRKTIYPPTRDAKRILAKIEELTRRIEHNNDKSENYYSEKKKILDKLQPQKEILILDEKKELDAIDEKIRIVKSDHNRKISEKKELIAQTNESLLQQNKALGNLEKDLTTFLMVQLITLLIALIEVSPVLVKLMTKRGVYDELLEFEENRITIEKQKDLDKQFAGISASIKINRQNRNKEVQINNDIIKDFVVPAQREIAEEIIKKWKQEQLAKI